MNVLTDPSQIHIINPMRSAYGGSEQRSVQLLKSFRRMGYFTRLWGYERCGGVADACPDVTLLRPYRLRFPFGGTFIFVGTYWRPPQWLSIARPGRVILIHNIPDKRFLVTWVDWLRKMGLSASTTVAYASKWLRDDAGIDGPIAISPIDLERFSPTHPTSARARPFTIGRMSRDVMYKHHPDDIALYRRLASVGIKIRLMGATCLQNELVNIPQIEILPCGGEDNGSFLRSLDAFFFRTDTREWIEPHGRVVTEALSAGVPVICSPPGGFLEWVEDGVTGCVVSNNDHAYAAINQLRCQPGDLARMSRAAREFAESVLNTRMVDANLRALLEYPPNVS